MNIYIFKYIVIGHRMQIKNGLEAINSSTRIKKWYQINYLVHPSLPWGGALEKEIHNTSTSPPPQPPPTTSLVRQPHPGCRLLPLSLPCGLPKGCVGEGNHHRRTPSCCGVSGSLSKVVCFRISAGNRVPGVIVVTVRVRVRGGAARATRESLLQDLQRP
jgi:hypothetical protein